jgi:catechol 2,3-dioxygenase-like lactoylglutathione lyase family enzyme
MTSTTPDPDTGLFGPHSVTWRVHLEPVLIAGGLRALIMQALHPEVMLGTYLLTYRRISIRQVPTAGPLRYSPARRGALMSRVQLALNVDDIDEAVAFYSKLFGAEPAKRRPGYANFAIAEPPLKLVLLENPGQDGSINHLGVEVASTDEVVAAARRLMAEGLETRIEDGTTCCYALQDKVWVTGPGGEPWEVYTVLADAGAELEGKTRADVEATPAGSGADGGCCGTAEAAEDATDRTVCCAS